MFLSQDFLQPSVLLETETHWRITVTTFFLPLVSSNKCEQFNRNLNILIKLQSFVFL